MKINVGKDRLITAEEIIDEIDQEKDLERETNEADRAVCWWFTLFSFFMNIMMVFIEFWYFFIVLDRHDRHDYERKDTEVRRFEKKKTNREGIDEANQLRARLGLKPLRPDKQEDEKKKEGRGDDRGRSSGGRGGRQMTEEDEIDETNKLRASLGLKPLKR